MNRAQTALYWKLWGRIAQIHGWRMQSARFVGHRLELFASPQLDRVYQEVWTIAEQLAAHELRGLNADCLRHACHIIAGARLSATRLENSDLDRLFPLFRVLAEPENLTALMAWQDSEAGERRRLLHAARHTPSEQYAQALASDRFGTTDLGALSTEQLRELVHKLHARAAAKAKRAPAAPASAADNEPF